MHDRSSLKIKGLLSELLSNYDVRIYDVRIYDVRIYDMGIEKKSLTKVTTSFSSKFTGRPSQLLTGSGLIA